MSHEQAAPKLKITCVQIDAQPGKPEENFCHVEEMICRAMEEQPDVIVLPESWSNYDTLKPRIPELCDKDGVAIRARVGGLAKKFHVNIVAGTEVDMHGGKIYNTAFVFNREGECVAAYDKLYLVYPNENMTVAEGDKICTFELDGVKCGVLTCNDLKFPEPSREIALRGAEMLFVPSAWPDNVMFRLHPLVQVRAIENQMFVINCNTCSKTSKKVNGGGSTVVAPFGQVLAKAGTGEEIFSCVCDLGEVQTVRANGQHFMERRRPELYKNL